MGMNFGNITKSSFQTDIKRKQAFFNRCKRRIQVANTPGEKQFLKAEAGKIVSELKQCSKKWKNFGFGACTWITKNFTVTNFNSACSGTARKSTTRPHSSPKNFGRSCSTRRTAGRSKARSNSRTRSNMSRRTYVAW